MPGIIVLQDDITRLPIVLVSKSDSGLTIQLSEHTVLPGSFRILFERTMEPCALVWQDGRLAGVQLLPLENLTF